MTLQTEYSYIHTTHHVALKAEVEQQEGPEQNWQLHKIKQ